MCREVLWSYSNAQIDWAGSYFKELHYEDKVIVIQTNLDRSPFYRRFIAQRGTSTGIAEFVFPEKLGWQPLLVSMKVDFSDSQKNSFWLPLFSYQRGNRINALFKALFRKFFNII